MFGRDRCKIFLRVYILCIKYYADGTRGIICCNIRKRSVKIIDLRRGYYFRHVIISIYEMDRLLFNLAHSARGNSMLRFARDIYHRNLHLIY